MVSSEALAPKKKAGIVKMRYQFETAKIHAIVRFQPKVAAIFNCGHPYMYSALQVGCQKKTDRMYLVVLYQHYISHLVVYLQHCGLYSAHVHYKTTR